MTVGGKSVDRKDSQTPMTVSNRDQLGLNRPHSNMHPGMDASDDISISATSFATSIGGRSMSIKELARAERRAAKQAKRELEMALANLPAPQFEYELAIPETVTDDEEKDNSQKLIEKDAADIEAEEIARLEKEAAELYEKRSSVVKRMDLPRPVGAVNEHHIFSSSNENKFSTEEDAARALVNEEMLVLLQHDAFSHPYVNVDGDILDDKKSKKKGKKKGKQIRTEIAGPPDTPLQYIDEDALDMAKSMLDDEFESVIQEKRSLASNSHTMFESDKAVKHHLSNETVKACIENDYNNDTISSLQNEYEMIQEAIEAIRKKADKLESKVSIRNGGYIKRAASLQESIKNDFIDNQNSIIEEAVFTSLMQHEQKGMTSRIDKLQEETELLEQHEALLQKRYGDLIHEKKRHELLLRQKNAGN